jgi:GcrA cell cycle regulator
MSHGNTTWPDERVDALKAALARGLSCTAIAAEIGAPSKSAVISKLRQLGLSPGLSRAARAAARAGRLNPRQRRLKGLPAAKVPLYDGWRKARQRRQEAQGMASQADAISPPETPAAPVGIAALEPHHCRWPVEGEGAAMLYCGATISGDRLSFCPLHCRMAYRPRS